MMLRLNRLIYEVEKIHHGTPSGIDNTVIVYERPVYFVRDKTLETLTIGAPLTLLIGDTGKSASTQNQPLAMCASCTMPTASQRRSHSARLGSSVDAARAPSNVALRSQSVH